MKMWRDKTFRRIFAWPFLVYITVFFVYVGGWDNAGRLLAAELPQWNESETPIEFSTDGRGILHKANELGNHPVEIFQFVRNNIRYEPYRGVRYGAVGTLERGRGSDADQAMLLAALLRAAWRNLHRSEPKLWIVKGNVRIEESQAAQWLGVEETAVETYLSTAGVDYTPLADGGKKWLQLNNHIWLRGDLEFGHYRASRFSQTSDGVLADLDPSIVVAKTVTELPDPFSISNIETKDFVEQVKQRIAHGSDPGLISGIPEAYLLDVADSGAAQFRRFLAEEDLDMETALENRKPVFEEIAALPDALPFELVGRPTIYKLATDADTILAQLRQRVGIRWVDSNGTVLADAIIPHSHAYGKPLLAVFTADTVTSAQLAMQKVAAGWANLNPGILLDGIAPVQGSGVEYTQQPGQVPYGGNVRLEFACQSDPMDPDHKGSLIAPFIDKRTEKNIINTTAGSMYALGAVPGLNTASSDDYTTRVLSLVSATSVGGTMQEHNFSAGKVLGPVLDLAAQGILSQSEELIRLCSISAGHRAALDSEWSLVGIETKSMDDGFTSPTLSFRTRSNPISLGRVLNTSDTRTVTTDALQNYAQLVRESVAAHSPRLILGLCPVSAGRVVRDGNLAGMPTRLFTSQNSEMLLKSGQVPQVSGVNANELKTQADQGHFILLPDSSTLQSTTSSLTSTLGKGWGALRRINMTAPGAWISRAHMGTTGMSRDQQVVADQSSSSPLKPADLVYGGNPNAYNFLADRAVVGLDSHLGASKSLGQAFVAMAHPILGMLDADASVTDTYELAADYGSAVVSLNAILDRFSKPQVTSFQLELYGNVADQKPSKVLSIGDVFNPIYYGKIVGRAQFNQRVDSATLELYNEANDRIDGQTTSNQREAVWVMKTTGVDKFNVSPIGPHYNGSIDVRIQGRVNNNDSAPVRYNFAIDTQPPDIRLIEWEPGRQYRGALAVRGTATDLHFKDYRILVDRSGTSRSIAFSQQPVAGVGLLATWDPGQDNIFGNCDVTLTATDIAGNTTSTTAAVTVWNDAAKPILQIEQPSKSPISGIVQLRITGSDNAGPIDSGIRRLRIWMDHKAAALVKNATTKQNDYVVSDVTEDLFNEDNLTSSTFVFEKSIDTRKLQVIGYPNTIGMVIHAEAEDLFGNVTQANAEYGLSNSMFNVTLSKSTLYDGNLNNVHYPIYINIYQFTDKQPTVQILKNGQVVKTLAKPTVSYNDGLPFVVYFAKVGGTEVPATYFTQFAWDGSSDNNAGPGEYLLRVTQGNDVQEFPVYLLEHTEVPNSFIDNPKASILFKDTGNGVVPITGYIDNPAFARCGSVSQSTPIESVFPAKRPYWLLSYKPHGVEPLVAEKNVVQTFLSANIQYESNWREITHGYANVGSGPSVSDDDGTTGAIANWDLSFVPEGHYDLRLVTTDGYIYRTLVIPNVQVTSHMPPGPPPIHRVPGDMTLSQTDFSVKFEGFPVSITRNYDSMSSTEKSDFGYGWSMSDINLKVSKSIDNTFQISKLQADITLPDGRTFTYANRPPMYNISLNATYNSFWRSNEFFSRPYGQHMWLPGHNVFAGILDLPSSARNTAGWAQVAKYKATHGGGDPDGSIACLQLEDGSFILFNWNSGRMLRRDMGDSTTAGQGRILDFDTTDSHTIISDNLGRSIHVDRNSDGLITSVTDPRGYACHYEYNSIGNLVRVIDRAGNQRIFEYSTNPQYPHYLTRMTVIRAGGNVAINYEYDGNGKLKQMNAGGADIDMQYEDFSTGGGVQTVVDKQTGGQTEVKYNAQGLVESKIDAAGVKTSYEYGEVDGMSGVLTSQTEGGVATSFDYDLNPYQTQYVGYDGQARQMVDYWLYQYSGGEVLNDYDQNDTIQPGFLTENQVQPTVVKSPAVGPDGNQTGTNDVTIGYVKQPGQQPDGTGKIYGIGDPEGRSISMDYATGAAHNEMASIDSQNSLVANTYVGVGNDFTGRIASSVTSRRKADSSLETVSTTNYMYSKIDDLSDAEAGTLFFEFNAAVESATGSISKTPGDFWPGFSTAYFESTITTTTQTVDGKASGSASFTDALGNTVATRSSDGKWSVTLCDAEQRGVFTHQDSGDWQTSEYDEAGLLTKTTHHPATGADEVTEYKYDANGRQIEVLKDGKKISGTEYSVSSTGARSVTQIDRSGNKSITETDSAGRTVREAFEGVGGARRETRYGYDADGRRNYVLSPNGLETRTAFDAAGREIETKTRAGGRDYVTRKGYDRFGRLVWSQDPQQAAASPQIYTTYLYVTDHTGGTAWTNADDCSGVTDPRYGQLAIVFHNDENQDPTDNTGFLTDSKSFEMYAYDSQGRQTDVVKPASLGETSAAITTTTTSYDEKGQVAAVFMNHRSDATTDSQTNLKFVFHYDSHGNRSEVVYPSGVVKQWNYKYNSNDELTSMTETQVGAAGAPASWKTTTYDPTTGLSSALIDAVGNVIASQYDSNSVLAKKIYTSAATPSQPAYNVNYSYDSDSGQLKEVKTYAGAGATQKVYGEAREYDAETGGLAKVSKESGGVGIGALNYAYNNTGALASISWLGRSVAYDYDEFGRMKTARANEADWEYTYAPCGKKATVHNTRANELETRDYDGLGRLKSIEHKNVNDNIIIFRIEYRLGPDGNRVGAFERRQTVNDDIATSWSYTYDPLGRLIRERRSINEHYGTDPNTFTQDRDTSYEYDCDSNRTLVTDHQPTSVSIEKYAYVQNTQKLHQVITGGGYKQYSWTANGEMAREDNYTGGSFDETETYYVGGTLKSSQIYTWGIGGTLVEVRFQGGDQDGCKVNYEYDSDNELIGRKVSLKNGSVSEDERYLVDHQNPTGYSQRLAVLDNLSGSIRHEIFTDELAAETTVNSGTANTQYVHSDALGSVRSLTGKSSAGENLGTSAERHFFDYTAFGSPLRGDRSLTNYAFTGQVYDQNSCFQYHRARWLDLGMVGWISPDSGFDWPLNYLSSYGYVGMQPIMNKDIGGNLTLGELIFIVIVIIIIVAVFINYVKPSVQNISTTVAQTPIGNPQWNTQWTALKRGLSGLGGYAAIVQVKIVQGVEAVGGDDGPPYIYVWPSDPDKKYLNAWGNMDHLSAHQNIRLYAAFLDEIPERSDEKFALVFLHEYVHRRQVQTGRRRTENNEHEREALCLQYIIQHLHEERQHWVEGQPRVGFGDDWYEAWAQNYEFGITFDEEFRRRFPGGIHDPEATRLLNLYFYD